MAVNPYFNQTTFTSEQSLLEDLVVESISIHGIDMYFLPRNMGARDALLTEDAQSYFDRAITTTFYVKNAEGWQGQGNFLSALGLEIRDQVTLTVAQRTFKAEVGPLPHPTIAGQTVDRPREGDLIFFPLNRKLFEVVYVEPFDVFFQLGKVYTWDLTVQVIEWNGQKFSTGVSMIDSIQGKMTEDQYDWALTSEDGKALVAEDGVFLTPEDVGDELQFPMDQTENFAQEGQDLFDFTETDPFSDGNFVD